MYTEFGSQIESLTNTPVIYIFLHQNADPDALCSAESIRSLILNLREEAIIKLFVDSLNVSSKRIANTLQIDLQYDIPDDHPELLITVDTANYSQLNKFEIFVRESSATKIVIDHHQMSELADQANLAIHDTNLGSTCLIVSKLYDELSITPSPRISTILICGHLYDSRRFIHGTTSEVFRIIANLIDFGGNYIEANEYLQNDLSLGEKIARIKASRRINYLVKNNILIATSKVSAFEASAARALIGLGCDATLVLARKENEIRGSARTTTDYLDMGEILSRLTTGLEKEWNEKQPNFVLSSGGHMNAAGLNIKPTPSNKQMETMMNRFLEIVEDLIPATNNPSV